jgi:hypothetical protein
MADFQPPDSLVNAVRDKKLVPFVGAGVSVEVVQKLAPELQFPNWKTLIHRLAARLTREGKAAAAAKVEATLPDTMAAAQLAIDELGRPLFLDEMAKAFGRRLPPPGADLSAVRAIWGLQAPFVITTNYDLVLEWTGGATVRVHNDDPSLLIGLDNASLEQPRVWHIHGSIERPDTLILTSEQYLKLYPDGSTKQTEYQNAFNAFQHLLGARSFLFMGFSLAEPVLRKKLEDVLALTAKAAPIKFLLLKTGEADAARQAQLFNDYHVQVIEFAEFGAPMIAAIDAIGRAAWPDAPNVRGWGLTADMEPLVNDLLQTTTGLVLEPAVIARAYNASKPQAWAVALPGGDGVTLLRDTICKLGSAVCSANVVPLLDFANRLSAEVVEPWVTRLRLWLDDAVDRLTPDAAANTALRQRLATIREVNAAERVQVLVRIRPGTTAAAKWVVHAWSWSGTRLPESLFGAQGRKFKEGAKEDVVYDLLYELESRDVSPDLTSIAFIVPGSLACEAIHNWRLSESVAKDRPIGAKYTVTVRPLERMERKPLVRLRFKKAWDDLKKRAGDVLAVRVANAAAPAARVPAVLLDTSIALPNDLSDLLEQQGARCVVLRDQPSLAQLTALLDTTTPAIVWSLDRTATPADVEQTMRNLLESVPVSDIPRRIRDERLAASRDETGKHHGAYLTLIWDDTDYVPPENEAKARARLETI